jgi:hypothetical protein
MFLKNSFPDEKYLYLIFRIDGHLRMKRLGADLVVFNYENGHI